MTVTLIPLNEIIRRKKIWKFNIIHIFSYFLLIFKILTWLTLTTEIHYQNLFLNEVDVYGYFK